MYGTQTNRYKNNVNRRFENDVNMYGTQTFMISSIIFLMFENDVNMYGTQTTKQVFAGYRSLRMM